MVDKWVDGQLVPITDEDQDMLDADAARPPPPVYVPFPLFRKRLKQAGQWPAAAAIIEGLPAAQRVELLSLEQGIWPGDEHVRSIVARVGLDPDVILAPP